MPIDMELFNIDLSKFEPHLSRLFSEIKDVFGTRAGYLTGLSTVRDFRPTRFPFMLKGYSLKERRAIKRRDRRQYRRNLRKLSIRIGTPVSVKENGIVPILRAMQANQSTEGT